MHAKYDLVLINTSIKHCGGRESVLNLPFSHPAYESFFFFKSNGLSWETLCEHKKCDINSWIKLINLLLECY